MTLTEKVEKLETNSKQAFQIIEGIYELLNAYASPEMMNQWSRVEPQAIVGEVYGRLALAYHLLKEIQDEGNGV